MKKTLTANQIFDEVATAIRGAISCAQEMHRLNEQMRDQLDRYEDFLKKILELQKIVDAAPEAQKLFQRIPRLRELRNMMELGSLSIETERAMDAVWQRLPK